jgi:hypothetical protein
MKSALLASTLFAFTMGWVGASRADEVADFYHGKTVAIVVGYSPGGGYDQAARILARHMPKHLPGAPNMVVQNMPGAGTLVAANTVNNTSLRDGSVIGMYADMMTVAPLLKIQGVQFDPRQLGWLGSFASRPTPVVFVRSDAPATTLAGVKEKEVLIGASGPDATASYALMANDLFGTKFKVIMGYKGGSSDINLAIERGEVHGRASWDWFSLKHDRPDWVAQKKVAVIMQLALEPNPELKGVPLATDLAQSDEDRQILELVLGTGKFLRAFSTPPSVPAARLQALREAFRETAMDKNFVADLTAVYPPGVDFSDAAKMEAFMAKVYAFPSPVIERSARYVGE